jgi:hypothetical protein
MRKTLPLQTVTAQPLWLLGYGLHEQHLIPGFQVLSPEVKQSGYKANTHFHLLLRLKMHADTGPPPFCHTSS